jgi:preprotein translocase subunit SecF
VELFPSNSNFNFMKVRLVSLAIAFLIMVVAFGAMGFKGFNYALDFTGGTAADTRFDRPVDAEQIRRGLQTAGYESPVVQSIGTGSDVVARIKPRASDGDAAANGAALVKAVQVAAALAAASPSLARGLIRATTSLPVPMDWTTGLS